MGRAPHATHKPAAVPEGLFALAAAVATMQHRPLIHAFYLDPMSSPPGGAPTEPKPTGPKRQIKTPLQQEVLEASYLRKQPACQGPVCPVYAMPASRIWVALPQPLGPCCYCSPGATASSCAALQHCYMTKLPVIHAFTRQCQDCATASMLTRHLCAAVNAFPSAEHRRTLGDRIGLTESQVQVWQH
jgi:hypothetical protein